MPTFGHLSRMASKLSKELVCACVSAHQTAAVVLVLLGGEALGRSRDGGRARSIAGLIEAQSGGRRSASSAHCSGRGKLASAVSRL